MSRSSHCLVGDDGIPGKMIGKSLSSLNSLYIDGVLPSNENTSSLFDVRRQTNLLQCEAVNL